MPKEYDLGARYGGRPDIERVGIFADMPRIEWLNFKKKPYVKKLPNALGTGPKIRCGNNDGYFNPFQRIFEKEGIPRPNYGKNKRVYVGGQPWVATGPAKWHATPGDIYGTFTDKLEAFSPVLNKAKGAQITGKQKRVYLPNFVTSPGKKGNAGYPNICLNKYPDHSNDKYGAKLKTKEYGKIIGTNPWVPKHFPQAAFDKNPYFEEKGGKTYLPPKKGLYKPNNPPGYWVPPGNPKKMGGAIGGCLNKFPEAKPDKYVSVWEATEKGKDKVTLNKEGRQWAPHSRGLKTMYTSSILHHNTDLRINVQNYKTYKTNYTKHILLNNNFIH